MSSYTALYRKWRPQVFEDVVEQEHVVSTLRNSVVSGRIAHAYLFCGTRGTGKTTMAHIFSRAINCLHPRQGDPCNECEVCRGILDGSLLDVIEIDAASNNSVDNVREIRDEVVYAPALAKYKVYIIDEVHMLSTGAFNALLKTLEEPPGHVVFVLATTEPHKLPPTILSRCQRFDFHRISTDSIAGRLVAIAEADEISLPPDAAKLLARMADGAMRDGISLLDQCIALGHHAITRDDVLAVAGVVHDDFTAEMVDHIQAADLDHLLLQVDTLVSEGKDISHFVSDLILHYRNLLICRSTAGAADIIDASAEALERIKAQAAASSVEEIARIIQELSQLESDLKWATQPRILLEVYLIRLCNRRPLADSHEILERLATLEQLVQTGAIVSSSKTPPAASVPVTAPVKEPAVPAGKAPKAARSPSLPTAPGLDAALWTSLIKEIKGNGRMKVYSALVDAKASQLDEKTIGISFEGPSSGISRLLVSRADETQYLEELLSARLGKEIRIRYLEGDQVISTNAPADPRDDFMDSLAKRLDVPVDILDE